MASDKLAKTVASIMYDHICDRASNMAKVEFPELTNIQSLWVEVGIAAGVTATIKALTEAGLLNSVD